VTSSPNFFQSNLELLADFFAGERAVLETDDRHYSRRWASRRRAFAVLVGVAFVPSCRKRVARAEADGDLAGLDQAEADHARRMSPVQTVASASDSARIS